MRIAQETRLLSELTARIRTGELAIPDIDEPYAWSKDDVERFFDSLAKGWPVGSLLMWRPKPPADPRVPSQAFPTRLGPIVVDASRTKSLVLDGRQRLLTLLWAGSPPAQTNSAAVVAGEDMDEDEIDLGDITPTYITWSKRNLFVADCTTRTSRFVSASDFNPKSMVPVWIMFDAERLGGLVAEGNFSEEHSAWLTETASTVRAAAVQCTIVDDAEPAEVKEFLLRSKSEDRTTSAKEFDKAARWLSHDGGPPKKTITLASPSYYFPAFPKAPQLLDVGISPVNVRPGGRVIERLRFNDTKTVDVRIHKGRAYASVPKGGYDRGSLQGDVFREMMAGHPLLVEEIKKATTEEQASETIERLIEAQSDFVYDGTSMLKHCGELGAFAGSGLDCIGFVRRVQPHVQSLIRIDGTDPEQMALARSFFRTDARKLEANTTASYEGEAFSLEPYDAITPLARQIASAAATFLLYTKMNTGTLEQIGRAVEVRRLAEDTASFNRDRTGWMAELQDMIASSEAAGNMDAKTVHIPLEFLNELVALSPLPAPTSDEDEDDVALANGF